MMVCDSGIRVPIPMPWTARPAMSTQKVGARPLMTAPSMKTTRPPR